ncbi:hypothetical protein AVEN_67503-1 [Araneus ventricosus]|uniref:Uncharacterized protein n=1 Tax=Araneus ventricosus TaxID=182803 RepID=A0A4Y2P1P7_ARAVE|nr:hypothetical protein AVEN_67503-1 [Araneus ventricosus]
MITTVFPILVTYYALLSDMNQRSGERSRRVSFMTHKCTRKCEKCRKKRPRPIQPEDSVRFGSHAQKRRNLLVATSPTFTAAFTLTANLPEEGDARKIKLCLGKNVNCCVLSKI